MRFPFLLSAWSYAFQRQIPVADFFRRVKRVSITEGWELETPEPQPSLERMLPIGGPQLKVPELPRPGAATSA
jgi:hypothetical protein